MAMDLSWLITNLEYIGGAGLLALVLYYNWPKDKDSVILRRFELSPAKWTLMGHDLGRGANPYRVKALGLIGIPDLVAMNKQSKAIKVFDYKHRTYRGKLRLYERYQVTLYVMAIEKMNPGRKVQGAIKFKNAIVDVQPTPSDRSLLMKNRSVFQKRFL